MDQSFTHRTDIELRHYLAQRHAVGQRYIDSQCRRLTDHDRFRLIRDEAALQQRFVQPGRDVVRLTSATNCGIGMFNRAFDSTVR